MNNEKYLKSLPKKRMAAGLLLSDKQGRILIVKPNYKDNWLIPGGVVEKDESPKKACGREAQEELGLKVRVGELLVLDYRLNDGCGDRLMFVFDGGVLSQEQIKKIKLQTTELDEYKFVRAKEALRLLSEAMARRLPLALMARKLKRMIYSEEGRKR